jgi:hypothetical protein
MFLMLQKISNISKEQKHISLRTKYVKKAAVLILDILCLHHFLKQLPKFRVPLSLNHGNMYFLLNIVSESLYFISKRCDMGGSVYRGRWQACHKPQPCIYMPFNEILISRNLSL